MDEEKKEQMNEQLKNTDSSKRIIKDGKVTDVYELLEQNNDSKTVIKIKNLLNYGATIEQIAQRYEDLSNGKISDIDIALENLEKAYRDVAIRYK